jgi:MFS family permease
MSYKYMLLPTFFYYYSHFIILSLSYQILLGEVCLQMNEHDCTSSEVSSHTSYLMIFISLTLSFPPLLLSGIYASIADKYGRKTVIIMPIIGIFIKIVILLYINILHPTYFFSLYLFSSFVYGILGSQVIFNMGIFTYIADITHLNISSRSKSYSIIELCIIIPKILGFLLSGLLSKYYGFTVPLLLTLIFTVFSLICVCIIPESLSSRRDVSFKLTNTYYNLKLLFVQSNIVIKLLSLAYFLFYFCLIGSSNLDILYFKYKFHWSSDYMGYYQTIEGVIGSFSVLLIYNLSNIYSNISVIHWIAIGYLCRAVYWCLVGFANTDNLLYIAVPFLLFTGVISPYTRTIISNSINKDDQAKSFIVFSTIQNLPALMIPLLDICYSISVNNNLSWLIYQIMSFLMCVSFITTLCAKNRHEFNIVSFEANDVLLEHNINNEII